MCGFVGIIGLDHVAPALFLGLQAIQHRGQDAAGIGVYDRGHVAVHKDIGLVSAALSPDVIASTSGTSGIAHVRYPTIGGGGRRDAQPFLTQRPAMALAHNGNVTNLPELERHLSTRGITLASRCDAEPIMWVLADELMQQSTTGHTQAHLEAAVRAVMTRVKGGFTVVAVLEIDGRETLIAFRDPFGIRPGVYGKREDGAWMAASESVSMDVIDFDVCGPIPSGHLMIFRKGEEPISVPITVSGQNHCIFEEIYFARPDSIMDGGRVYGRRWKMGERLADEWRQRDFGVDVVIPVPDTSRPAAMGMAARLGVPCHEGFIKNRYSGRTFIMPDPKSREAALRVKLNPIEEIFRDQRVVLVDDSIVRGTTMKRIVELVRKMKPRELHVAIFSPPVTNPCFYGIDMPTKAELVAAHIPPAELQAELARQYGANSVTFLSQAGLASVAGNDICAACFTGRYMVPLSQEELGFITQDRRPE